MPVTLSSNADDWRPLQLSRTAPPHTENAHYVHFLLTHTWNGLAIFAVYIIVRRTVQRILAGRRRRTAFSPLTTRLDTVPEKHRPLGRSVSNQQHNSVPGPRKYQQRVHYLFPPRAPPPSWMMMMEGSKKTARYFAAGEESNLDGSGSDPTLAAQGHRDGRSMEPTSGYGRPAHDARHRFVMMRPPPPPPLTPPAPPRTTFTLDGYRSSPGGNSAGFDPSFIHQPNPDYHTSASTGESSPDTVGTSPDERQRTHDKTIPIGIPASVQRHGSDPVVADQSGGNPAIDSDFSFSPSSYPPTSPFLPPAPFNIDGMPSTDRSLDLQGEVVSVTDGYGAGWTRHTRVYGGGVCLACAASGGEGGFYGATAIRPDDRS